MLSDEQLATRYRMSGDMDCFGILFERYTHLLFPMCYRYLGNEGEAEDIVMVVFEKLLVELKHTEVRNFKGWLYQVARNQCLMQLRHRGSIERGQREILQSELMEISNTPHLVPGETDEDNTAALLNAIELLADPQRRCIGLFYLEEKSYKEVADTTGFSLNEVKSHIQNGKRKLRLILEKNKGSDD